MHYRMILFVFCLLPALWAEDDSNQVKLGLINANYFDIYANPYVLGIRRGFTRYANEKSWRDSLDRLGIKHAVRFLNEDKYKSYYADSFSVINIWPGDFGGIFSQIMFKHRRDRIFRIWVYKIDENDYELREIEAVNYTAKEIADLLRQAGPRLFTKSL